MSITFFSKGGVRRRCTCVCASSSFLLPSSFASTTTTTASSFFFPTSFRCPHRFISSSDRPPSPKEMPSSSSFAFFSSPPSPRLVSPRLRIRHQPFLTRCASGSPVGGGHAPSSRRFQRNIPVAATSIEYTDDYLAPYQTVVFPGRGSWQSSNGGQLVDVAFSNDGGEHTDKESEDRLHRCPRLIDAEYMHGDEHEFWSERQSFRRSGSRAKAYYPIWDRQAQVMLAFAQRVPRVSAVAAFRLFTLGLRWMLLPQLATGGGGAGQLFPLRVVGGSAVKMVSLQEVAREKDNKEKKNPQEEEKKGEAVPETPSASSSSSPPPPSSNEPPQK